MIEANCVILTSGSNMFISYVASDEQLYLKNKTKQTNKKTYSSPSDSSFSQKHFPEKQ